MTFWQENYGFIKDVYDMRHQKMMEWMENVERVRLNIVFSKIFDNAKMIGNWKNYGR